MIPKEIFQKIRRIEITTSRLVTDVFAGEYHSVFKGRGMEFDEVREYSPGDDVRTIDWNVTARTGKPHVKKFVEERELTVMILVDVSGSSRFGSMRELKSKLAAEIAAVLAFAAVRNNDKVGLMIFTDRIEKFIPARKGLRHVLRIIREVLYFEPQGTATDIPLALEYLSRVTTRRTIAFVISDFFARPAASRRELRVGEERPPKADPPLADSDEGSQKFKKALAVANKRHDLVAVSLNDPRERILPDCGLLELEDAETSETLVIDSGNPAVRRRYEEEAFVRLKKRDYLFRAVGVDHINISTDSPYADEMVKFFLRRKRRFR